MRQQEAAAEATMSELRQQLNDLREGSDSLRQENVTTRATVTELQQQLNELRGERDETPEPLHNITIIKAAGKKGCKCGSDRGSKETDSCDGHDKIGRHGLRKMRHHKMGLHKMGHHKMGHHKMGHHKMGHHKMGHHKMGHHKMGHHKMGHHKMGHHKIGCDSQLNECCQHSARCQKIVAEF